jgi:hypothetical protein
MVSPIRKQESVSTEREDLASEELELCKKIDGFFQAMKLL